MTFKKSDVVLLIIILAGMLTGVLIYPSLPDQIPTHWNVAGEPDNYSSKEFGVFGLPIINLIIYFAMFLVPRLDPGRDNYKRFDKVYRISRWGIVLFLTLIHQLMLYQAYAPIKNWPVLDVSVVTPLLMGILFVVIGNYLTRARRTYFFGIRTPWTLEDETVWKKTHRLGGWLFVLAGIISLISPVFPGMIRFIVVISSILLAAFIPSVYSYFIFKKRR
ncbi:MAG: SdpI family protein [Bacillaceae bacterium]|nr:SdpI family protein [Bacillaceae bacterium]